MLAFQYDTYDGAFSSKAAMQDYAGCVSTNVWRDCKLTVDCKQLAQRQRFLYVLPQGTSPPGDSLQYFAGNFVIATSNLATGPVNVGELFVRYHFNLKKPLVPGGFGSNSGADPPAYEGEARREAFTPSSGGSAIPFAGASFTNDDPSLTWVNDGTGGAAIGTSGQQGLAKDFNYYVQFLHNIFPSTNPTASAFAAALPQNGAAFTYLRDNAFTTVGTAAVGGAPVVASSYEGILDLSGVTPEVLANAGNTLLEFVSPSFTGGTGLTNSAEAVARFIKVARNSGLAKSAKGRHLTSSSSPQDRKVSMVLPTRQSWVGRGQQAACSAPCTTPVREKTLSIGSPPSDQKGEFCRAFDESDITEVPTKGEDAKVCDLPEAPKLMRQSGGADFRQQTLTIDVRRGSERFLAKHGKLVTAEEDAVVRELTKTALLTVEKDLDKIYLRLQQGQLRLHEDWALAPEVLGLTLAHKTLDFEFRANFDEEDLSAHNAAIESLITRSPSGPIVVDVDDEGRMLFNYGPSWFAKLRLAQQMAKGPGKSSS